MVFKGRLALPPAPAPIERKALDRCPGSEGSTPGQAQAGLRGCSSPPRQGLRLGCAGSGSGSAPGQAQAGLRGCSSPPRQGLRLGCVGLGAGSAPGQAQAGLRGCSSPPRQGLRLGLRLGSGSGSAPGQAQAELRESSSLRRVHCGPGAAAVARFRRLPDSGWTWSVRVDWGQRRVG